MPSGDRRSQRARWLVIDSGFCGRFPDARCAHAQRREKARAEIKPFIAGAVKLAKADYGIAERARVIGGYPYLVSLVRRTAGWNAKRNYEPKPGGPERATQLLRELKEF
jgi:hypothetical protein